MATGKFKLLADHYIDDRLLPAGTVIGEGTPYPFSGEPSLEMEGLDDNSKDMIQRRFAGIIDPRGVEDLRISGGSDTPPPGPRLEMVGEPPVAPAAGNPLIRDLTHGAAQPIQPYAIEQTSGSAVARPDFGKTPEQRQQDHDAIASSPTNDGVHVSVATPQDEVLAPSEGNQDVVDPADLKAPATAPARTVPTESGQPSTAGVKPTSDAQSKLTPAPTKK